jgi:hypothetical protein
MRELALITSQRYTSHALRAQLRFTGRVYAVGRIPPNICIGVQSAFKTYRIRLQIPSGAWIVIPEVVVIIVAFLVVILPRK